MITLPFSRKPKEKQRTGKSPRKDVAKKSLALAKKEKKTLKTQRKELGRSDIAYAVLKEPLISEKGTILEEEGKYLFKVFPRANKKNIKKSVEEIYKVHVKKVNIIKMPAKKRKRGTIIGKKKGYKKAIVTLARGEKIEIISR
ncbi:MAG: 50S ribosomal protein L23 [Patescibacteria group bacterium]